MKYNVTVGADPEFFVKKNGKVIPACGLFGGGKGSPVLLSPEGGYLEDGCAVEFNVSPSPSLAETYTKIKNLTGLFLQKFPDYSISDRATVTFTRATLKDCPSAFHIGCASDLAAWGVRETPNIQNFGLKRFAGGHVHIGIDPWPEGLSKMDLVRYFDIMALLPVLITQDVHRGRFYGNPGLYRETSYGIEWRSPDNSWAVPGIFSRNERFTNLVDAAVENLREMLLNWKSGNLASILSGLRVGYRAHFECLDSMPYWKALDKRAWLSLKEDLESRII